MRVFLVNEINKYDSVGINLISAILKKEGHESRVCLVPDLIENTTITMKALNAFKFAFHISDSDYIDYLLSFKPDVIGFSVVTAYWKRASSLASLIKEKNPNVKTVAGGPHITVSLFKEMFDQSGFDYICKGDGEIAFPKLISAIEKQDYEPCIPGIYYLRDGEMIGEGVGEVENALDILPFQDKSDVFRDYPYLQRLYVVNSQRTCQFSCTYCGSPNYRDEYAAHDQKIFRRRSVESLVKELFEAKRKYPKMKRVGFFDDTFTTGKQWIKDFAREYKKYVGLPFFCCTNPCLLQDEDIVYQLKEAGMAYVEIGVQAIDEEFRVKTVLRPDKDKHIFKTAQMLRKHGVYFQANHIFGLDLRDFDNRDFLNETVEYYLKLNANRNHCFELEYLPSSGELKRAKAENRITQDEYDQVQKGESSVSYNFGGSIKGKKKLFVPYLVLMEMTPFLPDSIIRKIMYNKLLFQMLKLVPFNYIILARLLNTIKDSRDIEGSPHYGKYIDGALYVMKIKRYLSSIKQEQPKKPIAGSGFIEDQATPTV
jgi:anaerobic magnesium-protoporphyrin IX monomethyl ester cyclase